MPSNAMTISQLIPHLQDMLKQHGDLDVVVPSATDATVLAITKPNVTVVGSLPWAKLPSPVLTLGFEPRKGAVEYQTDGSGAPNGWSYALMDAPLDIDVDVWKRHGGQDIGRRGERYWAVYEGGARAWDIVDGGVLAWKLRA